MAKIGAVGGTYQEWSLPFAPQRSVNLYPVLTQGEQGKEISALYNTPGLRLFTQLGVGKSRGLISAANGRVFSVVGSKLYEIFADATSVERGNLEQSNGIVTMADNGFQLAICDKFSVYILTYATNAYQKVTAAGFPVNGAGTISFIDSYFVVNENNTGRFYISAPFDGLSWNALDFATAESDPDNLLRAFSGAGFLWLFGRDSTEIWSNTGDSVFPFERVSGAQMSVGILSPFTVIEIDKILFWLGQDTGGSGTVYRTNGFNATPISTPPIEQKIARAGGFDKMTAFTYNQDGHKFYVLTGGGLETSLVYDLTTGLWHERAFKNEQGNFEQHIAITHCYAFGMHLVGDRRNGKIYEMSTDLYSDDGVEIVSERIFTNISDENRETRINRLEVDLEAGVGLNTGQGIDPVATLEVSKDGGRTWSGKMMGSIGKMGQTRRRLVWRRLGVAEQLTFRLRISDPVKRAITGGFLS